jgi:hypothetical protein
VNLEEKDGVGVYLMPRQGNKRNSNIVLLSNSCLEITTSAAQTPQEMGELNLFTFKPNTVASAIEGFIMEHQETINLRSERARDSPLRKVQIHTLEEGLG